MEQPVAVRLETLHGLCVYHPWPPRSLPPHSVKNMDIKLEEWGWGGVQPAPRCLRGLEADSAYIR